MSDTLSDADKVSGLLFPMNDRLVPRDLKTDSVQIRNKRLAKLSNPIQTSGDGGSESAQSSAHTSPAQSPLSAQSPLNFHNAPPSQQSEGKRIKITPCLLYTSDAADEMD